MTEQLMIEGESKTKTSKLLLITTFVVCFLFFFYLTFPYNVVKEYAANMINAQTGMNLTIGELEPKLPLGFAVSKVNLATQSGSGALALEHVEISLSLWSLLTGKLGANVSLQAGKNGSLDASLRFALGQVLSGEFMPSRVLLDAESFPIDGLVDLSIAMGGRNPGQDILLWDFLKKLRLGGGLNGSVDLDIEPKDLTQSLGELKLGLSNGFFWLDDSNLNISRQNFTRASIEAKLENSRLVFGENSGFVSQELKFLFGGFLQLQSSLPDSRIDLNVELSLQDSLQAAIGFIVDNLTGGVNGQSKFALRGPLSSPSRQPL